VLQADLRADATLVVAIGALRVEWGVMARGQWVPDSASALSIAPVGADATLAGVCAALERVQVETGAARLRAVVADKWLAVASVPWSAALQEAERADAFARGQLLQAGHELQAVDTLRLDDAAFAQPRLAVAYPALLLDALRALAARSRARLASVLPTSVAGWALAARGRAALAVLDQGQVVLAQGAWRLADVTLREGGVAELQGLWQRTRLRDPRLAAVTELAVLDLAPTPESPAQAVAGLTPIELPLQARAMSRALQLAGLAAAQRLAIDAVPPEAPVTWLRRAVAAAVLLVAGGLSLQAWQAVQRVNGLQQQLDAAQVRSAPAAPAALSRDEQARVPAVNAAIREMNLPVSALLQALQPPRDIRVAVLGVDVLGATPGGNAGAGAGIKITGEARTGAEMARYVAFVSSRKPFTGAYLTHHEIDETTPERPYRFTLEAAWND
jgi:hypothetical protein